jgi:hypothetical protein
LDLVVGLALIGGYYHFDDKPRANCTKAKENG